MLQASSYLSIGYNNITSCEDRESNTIKHFTQKSLNVKIAKKNARMQTRLVNPIINLEKPFEKVLKKEEYIAIKYQNTPGDNDSWSYESNLHYYGGGSPEEWLV